MLVWPGVVVSTGMVFSALEHRDNPALPETPTVDTPDGALEFLRGCRNDPLCTQPDWDITKTPPSWWTCPAQAPQ